MARVNPPKLLGLFQATSVRTSPLMWYVFTSLVSDSLYSDSAIVTQFRNGGKLVSDIKPGDMCIPINCSLEASISVFELLQRAKWVSEIQGYWHVGNIEGEDCKLFARETMKQHSKPRKIKRESKAMRQLADIMEARTRARCVQVVEGVAPSTRKHVIRQLKGDSGSASSRLLAVLKASHDEHLGKPYPMARNDTSGTYSYPKESKFINRLLGLCENSEELTRKIIIWTMKNWKEIKADLRWEGSCNTQMMSTLHAFKRIKEMYSSATVEGFLSKTTSADRYSESNASKAPEVGF
jgi:hypothetical protein